MKSGIPRQLLRAEGGALVLVMGLATLFALMGVTFILLTANGLTSIVIEIAARFALLTWVATFVYMMPFAGTVGVATFLVLLKAKYRLISVGAGTVVTVLSAWIAYPTVEKCTTSISARQSLLETLPPLEAATLRSPPTLSDPNDFCPTYFEYRTNSGWVEASAVFGLANGVQIFKKALPRTTQ